MSGPLHHPEEWCYEVYEEVSEDVRTILGCPRAICTLKKHHGGRHSHAGLFRWSADGPDMPSEASSPADTSELPRDDSVVRVQSDRMPMGVDVRAPRWKEDWADFEEALKAKLQRGFSEYGDGSFDRPTQEILQELQEEALDLAGWGMILWSKIKRARERA